MRGRPYCFASARFLPVRIGSFCVGVGAKLQLSDVASIASKNSRALSVLRRGQIDRRQPVAARNPAIHVSHQPSGSQTNTTQNITH